MLTNFRVTKHRLRSEIAEADLIAKQGASLIRPPFEADCWVIVLKGLEDPKPGHTFDHPIP